MTQPELEDARVAVARWRRRNPPTAARRLADLAAIPEQVAASMAFEGEPVDRQMLADHLQTILARGRASSAR